MKIGFIGLGNVGGKLAGCLLRNGFDLTVRDLERAAAQPLPRQGCGLGREPQGHGRGLRSGHHLPAVSPAASAAVMEAEDGILAGLGPSEGQGKIWAEMSTTDEAEVKRLGALVREARRRGPGLPGLRRLSPGGDRQYRDLRRRRARHLRARCCRP
jgi:3-hydroxyisobutyrate dehydrogenase